jgi:hypothetical protein
MPGPSHPDWPWVGPGGPPETMTDRQHRRWRAQSERLRAELAKRLGRRPTGRELIDLCDRPAAAAVLGMDVTLKGKAG